MKVNNPILFVFILTMSSCSQKTFDSKEELMTYVTDVKNGYTQQKTINGVDFTLSYRPTDMLVQQVLSEHIKQKELDSLRKKYSAYLYFNLSISKNNQEVLNGLAGNRNEFGKMVNQLAFGMENKVHLISQQRDTIDLADYIYPRMYGMGKSTNILLVYPRNLKLLKQDYFQFTIEDLGFSTGEVGFKINTVNIIKEPLLNFN